MVRTVKGRPEKGPPCDDKRVLCAGEERWTMEGGRRNSPHWPMPRTATSGQEIFHRMRVRSCVPLWRSKPTQTEELQPARFSSLQIDLFWHGTTRTTKEATSGCFWWIIRKLSTQLAQSAATIDLEALRNPQSPMEKSREARSFASLLRLSPTSRERHDCVAASCSKANCATSQGGAPRSPSVGAVQQEQPGSLEVQGCAQTGLNAKQSSGGDLNARIQAGLGHFRTTTEHGSTTFAVAVNCVHPGGQCLPLFQTCILPK